MKCSALLLSLALACGTTVASAATVQDAKDCALGEACSFSSDGSIVYFVINYDESSTKQQFHCELTNKDESNTKDPVAKVYSGKDAHFITTKLTVDKPVDLSVRLRGSAGVGQIKVQLLEDRTYEPESVAVTCSEATTAD